MPTELDVVSVLLIWGPLGVFNAIQALAIRALFKRMADRDDAHRVELAKREASYDIVIEKVTEAQRNEMVALADRQRTELVALAERHLTATNTWTQHYQAWAERATAVLEALHRRAGRR